jgi:hypothetical protein
MEIPLLVNSCLQIIEKHGFNVSKILNELTDKIAMAKFLQYALLPPSPDIFNNLVEILRHHNVTGLERVKQYY